MLNSVLAVHKFEADPLAPQDLSLRSVAKYEGQIIPDARTGASLRRTDPEDARFSARVSSGGGRSFTNSAPSIAPFERLR